MSSDVTNMSVFIRESHFPSAKLVALHKKNDYSFLLDQNVCGLL